MRRINSEAYYIYVEDPAYAGQDADDDANKVIRIKRIGI